MNLFNHLVSHIQERHSENYRSKAMVQLYIQVTLIVLLLATIVLVCFTQSGWERFTYITMISALTLCMGAALLLNLRGKYKAMSFITVFLMVVGPWLSTSLNKSIASGDFIPFIYLTIPIQICAIFLSEGVTIAIAASQFILLLIVILSNLNDVKFNWPSLVAYVFFSLTLGIVTSIVSKKQVNVIEEQRHQLQENAQALLVLSTIDALTGLYNRRYLDESLHQEIDRAALEGSNLSIIMVDIDHFKTINDTFGHAVGDSILEQVARILKAGVRSGDILCRFGGDEFIIILPGCDIHSAQMSATRLCTKICNTVFTQEGKNIGAVTASLGVATIPDHGNTKDEVLREADLALYLSKTEGRNKVTVAKVFGTVKG